VTEHVVSAREFVRAGGTFDLAEWAQLSPEERTAAAEAGDERLQRTADLVADTLVERLAEGLAVMRLDMAARKAEEVTP
jgi:hypothetical protein